MIVCSCHGITDSEIRRELSPEGQGQCLAGTGCGNCLPLVADIVRRTRSGPNSPTESMPRRRPGTPASENASQPPAA